MGCGQLQEPPRLAFGTTKTWSPLSLSVVPSTTRFQSANALELIRRVLRTPSIPPNSFGVLRFTEGQAHLASGSTIRAQKAFEEGFVSLQEDVETQTLLAIQCVQEWIVRGDIERAHVWLGHLDQNNQGESLRLSAGLSRQAGEWLGATALLIASQISSSG